MSRSVLLEARRRLGEVTDPCSAATQVPLSIVDMGMIADLQMSGREIEVALRITSPMCHALPYFQMEIERVLGTLPEVDVVSVTADHGGNWQPEDMSEQARRRLAARRATVAARLSQASA